MSKRVIYLEQEREIKSMAGNLTMKEISDSLKINYKTLHGWCKRTKVYPKKGHVKTLQLAKGVNNFPSAYAIPGIIREQLSIEEVKSLTKFKYKPTLDQIKCKVAEYYSITVDAIDCKSHKREYAWPRHVFFLFALNITGLSLKAIGLKTGQRDRTTVIHGVRVVTDVIDTDRDKAREVREIGGIIKNLISNES